MTNQQMPEGFTAAQIREIAEHYENLSEDELLAELETAWDAQDMESIDVPSDLVPTVQELIKAYTALRATLNAP